MVRSALRFLQTPCPTLTQPTMLLERYTKPVVDAACLSAFMGPPRSVGWRESAELHGLGQWCRRLLRWTVNFFGWWQSASKVDRSSNPILSQPPSSPAPLSRTGLFSLPHDSKYKIQNMHVIQIALLLFQAAQHTSVLHTTASLVVTSAFTPRWLVHEQVQSLTECALKRQWGLSLCIVLSRSRRPLCVAYCSEEIPASSYRRLSLTNGFNDWTEELHNSKGVPSHTTFSCSISGGLSGF